MNSDFDEKAYREAFVEEMVSTGVAFQVRALRGREGWTQGELGQRSDKKQNVISRIENPDYGKVTISTLLSLAAAFDVALQVRFVSFGDLWKSTRDLSKAALLVNRYSDERPQVRNVNWSTGYAQNKAGGTSYTKVATGGTTDTALIQTH